jgi:hypothetical protein
MMSAARFRESGADARPASPGMTKRRVEQVIRSARGPSPADKFLSSPGIKPAFEPACCC